MPPPRPSRFLGKPTLGGWLTITNCAFWASMVVLASTHPGHISPLAEQLLMLTLAIFAFPFGCCLLLPPEFDHHSSLLGILVTAMTIGFNSLVWGYGLARLTGNPARQSDKSSREDRAFPVVTSVSPATATDDAPNEQWPPVPPRSTRTPPES